MNRFNRYSFHNYEVSLDDNVINFPKSIHDFIVKVRKEYEEDLNDSDTNIRSKATKFVSVVIQGMDTSDM